LDAQDKGDNNISRKYSIICPNDNFLHSKFGQLSQQEEKPKGSNKINELIKMMLITITNVHLLLKEKKEEEDEEKEEEKKKNNASRETTNILSKLQIYHQVYRKLELIVLILTPILGKDLTNIIDSYCKEPARLRTP
jgi:hypothetical protein